jgi:glycosyltransferase involved in cell wall biosynthesis
MRVSVVICTYNRSKSLAKTLDCLRGQTYRDFEVVVINGPSTDDTDAVLERWSDCVRVDTCPVANLSVSRNIGIRAAGGDIVAFIDDDALPDFSWLEQALPSFAADDVAAVGGIVFDHTGMDLQYRYSAADRFAEPEWRFDRSYEDQCFPGSFQFPYLQGTNALFRRSRLLQVGGFDETYDYYLDETDLCCRLVDSGYLLRQLPDAAVHHKFLPSTVRNHQRVITNWFPVMKNQTYFAYRHALGSFSEHQILERLVASMRDRIEDARIHEAAGRLPPGSTALAAEQCTQAIRVGAQLGLERHTMRLGPVEWPAPEFSAFPTIDTRSRRQVTFVSSGYTGNITGGIARFISDVAPALARRGHEVRVITKAAEHSAVDFEDAVWVHRIAPLRVDDEGVLPGTLDHINDFATASVRELERIATWTSHDVIYGPLWDLEILGAIRRTGLPTVVHIATPLAVAAEMAGFASVQNGHDSLNRLIAMEEAVLSEADILHANGHAVIETIQRLYTATVDRARWDVVPLGTVDNRRDLAPNPLKPDRVRIFYVGRFEARKGIDTLLEAMTDILHDFEHVEFVAAGEDRPLRPGEPLCGISWLDRHSSATWLNRVWFEGTVNDERLHELYASADIVVLPSRYESFGLVMVEAMMHGKALVSCDAGGVRDVVRNGVDGLLVEPGNPHALAGAIRRLLEDGDLRRELGLAARARFVDAFHIDRCAQQLERLLERTRLIDASNALAGPVSAFELVRGSTGHPAALLRPGDRVRLPIGASSSAARISIRAVHASVILIDSGHKARTHRLKPGEFRRIDVDSCEPTVQVRLVRGGAIVDGVVTVGAIARP